MDARRITRMCAVLALCSSALAAVPAEEATRLGAELTPLGAERAGNREGTIPAWEGGYTEVPPGYRSGDPRPDPFAGEKPLYSVTAANMEQHAAHLTEGVKELLGRFPGFRLDVYRTHRTAAAPQWVYDNTRANAVRARPVDDGVRIEGAFGGIPFPIPRSGREAMWNHLLAWKGEAVIEDAGIYLASGGRPFLTVQRRADYQYPYYYREGSVERFKGIYALERYLGLRPPSLAGESYVVFWPIDQAGKPAQVWGYFVGQRRVRAMPKVAYDTPDFTTSGLNMHDEAWLFQGGLDRYEWQLLGKREVLVPYNANGFSSRPIAEVLGQRHVAPASVRWELHRVWVVEARLAPGKRHPISKRRLYLDEDTWLALLYDGWDGTGRLWHVAHALPQIIPELPAVIGLPEVMYDLHADRYAALFLFNEGRLHYQVVARRSDDYFSPAALVGEGVR